MLVALRRFQVAVVHGLLVIGNLDLFVMLDHRLVHRHVRGLGNLGLLEQIAFDRLDLLFGRRQPLQVRDDDHLVVRAQHGGAY
ncbi:MAG: hypothetical protein M5U26_19090 [Planctomycetota bacterium]|nr:hypothetical protein [Planctomycetota bacterium]